MTPFKKVVFTSIWCNFHCILAARAMIVLIEVYLATRKCLYIINSSLLRRAMSYKPCFIFLNNSINNMFYIIYPFVAYHILALRSRKYFPYIIFYNGLVLFCHGIEPFFILNGFFKQSRLLIYKITP